MKRLGLLLLLALALPAAASADPPQPGIVHAPRPPGASLKTWGASLYAGNCSSCHGSNGVGVKDRGPSLRGVGALAADFYLATGYMPLHSPTDQPHRSTQLLSGAEVNAIVAYIASLGGPAIPKPQPNRGNVADGLQLFTDHCAGCHQVAAQGGYVKGAVVPELTHATPTQIAEAVRIGPYLMPRFSKKQISDRQLDSIIAYVRYSQHPDNAGGWSIGRIGPVPEGLVAWLIAGVVLVGLCVVIGERLRRE
jgi:ubiquinol-cytochrome c reductase cytochrome c subunit